MSNLLKFIRSPQAQAMDSGEWNREVLKRLGIGFAQDPSGFYRPTKITPPRDPEPEREPDNLPVGRKKKGLQLTLF